MMDAYLVMMYGKPDVWVGQYRVMARRIGPARWKCIVLDTDVPEPRGVVLHESDFHPSSPTALREGRRRLDTLFWKQKLRKRSTLARAR